jgi:hypothetical protein
MRTACFGTQTDNNQTSSNMSDGLSTPHSQAVGILHGLCKQGWKPSCPACRLTTLILVPRRRHDPRKKACLASLDAARGPTLEVFRRAYPLGRAFNWEPGCVWTRPMRARPLGLRYLQYHWAPTHLS